MRLILISLCALLSLQLTACNPSPQTEEPAQKKMSEDNPLKGYGDAVDKAKGVEQTVQEGLEQRQQQADDDY